MKAKPKPRKDFTQVDFDIVQQATGEVLPAYEADDGELTKAQLTAIRKATPQGHTKLC